MVLQKINSILHAALLLALLAVMGYALALMQKANAFLSQVASDEAMLSRQLGQDATDAHRDLVVIGGAASQVEQAARTQKKYWNESGRETVALLHHADEAVQDLRATNISLQQSISDVKMSAVAALDSVPMVAASAEDALQSANRAVSNPDIYKTVDHLEKTTAHIESSTKAIDDKVHQALKPVGLLHRAFSSLLDVSYKLASFFK